VTGKHLYNVREDTLQLQKDIVSVIEDIAEPMTVRQIYYRLVASGHPKTEEFYSKTQRALLDMRERGSLPYGLIADNTRSFYKARTFNNLETCLTEAQQYYRKDFWESQDSYVEIWLEKEALRSVFNDVTYEMQIPLYVTKGFSSISFMYAAAEEIKLIEKPAYIYLFSDYDPSGLMVYNSFKKRMREFGVKAQFIRPCLTPDQIEDFNVIMRPTKKSNHSRDFVGDSAELDALHPRILKSIVRNCIDLHIDQDAYQKLKNIEAVEKETLKKIADNLRYAS
jgi:5S rRNA maturation endonuclease (ribonuclease M5)